MNRTIAFSLVFFFAVTLVFSGCGKDSGTVGYVSGKVTVPDEKDPAGLLIRFVNGATGIGATAVVDENGTYELKHKGAAGVPIGTYKISITAYKPQMSDKEYTDFMNSPPAERKQIEAQRNEKMSLVPKKYHKASSSGLSYEIASGTQVHDIVISE